MVAPLLNVTSDGASGPRRSRVAECLYDLAAVRRRLLNGTPVYLLERAESVQGFTPWGSLLSLPNSAGSVNNPDVRQSSKKYGSERNALRSCLMYDNVVSKTSGKPGNQYGMSLHQGDQITSGL